MNVRLRMYQVLLFKFGRHLCKGAMRFEKVENTHCFFYFSWDIFMSQEKLQTMSGQFFWAEGG